MHGTEFHSQRWWYRFVAIAMWSAATLILAENYPEVASWRLRGIRYVPYVPLDGDGMFAFEWSMMLSALGMLMMIPLVIFLRMRFRYLRLKFYH
jgi:hypothetical protein